jgi:hypothetical protein
LARLAKIIGTRASNAPPSVAAGTGLLRAAALARKPLCTDTTSMWVSGSSSVTITRLATPQRTPLAQAPRVKRRAQRRGVSPGARRR